MQRVPAYSVLIREQFVKHLSFTVLDLVKMQDYLPRIQKLSVALKVSTSLKLSNLMKVDFKSISSPTSWIKQMHSILSEQSCVNFRSTGRNPVTVRCISS
ncbi:hypothetical protein ACH3XW_42850 [Acanthocheilonema viteae]